MYKEATEKLPCRWHRPEFQKRSQEVSQTGKNMFENTALSNGKAVSQIDNILIRTFIQTIAPDTEIHPHLSNWESLTEHCDFAGRIAFKLSDAVNKAAGTDLNPHAGQAALQLHDLGRTVIHSFMETDVMTDILWDRVGLRTDLKDLTHNAHLYWDEGDINFEQLPITTRISVLADVLGKRSNQDRTRLRHTDEVIDTVKSGKAKYLQKADKTIYEQQLVAEKLDSYSKKEEYIISKCISWVEVLNININSLLDEVMTEYNQEKGALCPR